MSLKRRNIIAWILLLIAATGWVFGRQFYNDSIVDANRGTVASSEIAWETTPMPSDSLDVLDATVPHTAPVMDVPQGAFQTQDGQWKKTVGILLCVAAVVCACIAVFLLRQKQPVFGPDGIAILAVATCWGYAAVIEPNGVGYFFSSYPAIHILLVFLVVLFVRELWGWILEKLSLSWCLLQRLAGRASIPQLSLLVFMIGLLVPISLAVTYVFSWYRPFAYLHREINIAPIIFAVAAVVLVVLCLWKYGSDLNHFKKQLNYFQQGLPITVKTGAFEKTEEQLQNIQTEHAEAVRTAVTSERFKVELISNVSHDLRTPLTSIIGYGELLQKEKLSPEGQEQLRRLQMKAGYMNDLVESLFELTKVSSGVVESKKERIDLIRLLEQTIGLLDDQLLSAGLVVRRNYEKEAISTLTDGTRMHHVFANLLGNAIKYALAGTRIYLEVREEETCIRVRMVNTASYEMDFKADEIMQRFARGDKARSTKGSGLGLAIAQTYTESVGGAFRVSVDGDQFSAIVELPKL